MSMLTAPAIFRRPLPRLSTSVRSDMVSACGASEAFVHRNERVTEPAAAEQANGRLATLQPERRAPRGIARKLAQAIGKISAVAGLMEHRAALRDLGGAACSTDDDRTPAGHRLRDHETERLRLNARMHRDVERPQDR